MNPIRTIPRAALGLSLKVARLPLDQAARLLGGRSGEVGLDRVEADVRDAAGTVTGDAALQRDAGRRRAAAEDRGRAIRVEDEAERAEAAKRSAAQKRKRSADAAARRRKQQADRVAAERKDAARAEAREQRLSALDEQAEALEAEEDALAARDEAKRLKAAAADIKRSR